MRKDIGKSGAVRADDGVVDALPVRARLDQHGARTEPAFGLDHPRSGELVALSHADSWFTYYHWLDDERELSANGAIVTRSRGNSC